MRQLVYTMFNTNNHASFYLRWKEKLVKYQNVLKYYVHDCTNSITFSSVSYVNKRSSLIFVSNKFQKQPIADIFQNRCSQKSRNIHKKAPVFESLFNKVAGLKTFSCEHCDFLRNTFLYRTPPVAASKII